MLSLACFEHLAKLLNMIEEGRPWPEAAAKARAAFLEKELGKQCDPLCFRVLLILTPLYRRWASVRLKTLKPWIQKWAEDEMYAGAGSKGAEDAWFELALDIEEMKVKGISYCGGGIDIAKCFDQISRPLLYILARAAGMPERILNTYQRFQEQLIIYNTIAGG